MERTTDNRHLREVAGTSKRLLGRLVTIVDNRLELLTVELQEERLRLLHALLLGLGTAVFGFLAGVALTIAGAIFFWEYSPAMVVLALAFLYGGCAAWLYGGFVRLQRDWRTLPNTIEQLRKDCECLERNLE
jgi:uncharacterized membrane protein YqjE